MENEVKILLVDDDISLLKLLALRIESRGYQVFTATSASDALTQLTHKQVDLVITDLRMDQMDGLEFQHKLQQKYPSLPVIMLTAHGSITDAVEATKQGVFAFLTKPVNKDILFDCVQQAVKLYVHPDTRVNGQQTSLSGLITRSGVMLHLIEQIRMLANTDARILINGESGTGKELLAKEIHLQRLGKDAPFIAINCGAIPAELLESELFGHKKGAFSGATRDHQGIFQQANNGTLFLDEIGDMPLPMQVKLLRVLQESRIRPVGSNQEIPIQVHIVSATHRDLLQEIDEQKFREDLYYRLNVVNLQVPPLRDRREDIPLLAEHFASEICLRNQVKIKHYTADAMRVLLDYPWPGNIRELQNLVEQLIALTASEMIPVDQVKLALHQQSQLARPASLTQAKKNFERDYLLQMLDIAEGNMTEAARLAGRNRSDFYKLVRKHEISIEAAKNKGNSD